MDYIEFASKISFYEFLQDEFKAPHFKTEDYAKEIEELRSDMTIEGLSKKLQETPKLFDILEELFQLDHFTDAQYIHFCFDVNTLNNSEDTLIYKYISNRIFKFENGKTNSNFLTIYNKISSDYKKMDQLSIFYAKRAIVNYITKASDRKKEAKRKILFEHIKNSIETRLRISTYLLENLNAKYLLASLDIKKFLKQKRHPVDPKGIRGKFGTIKITKTLKDAGFVDLTAHVGTKSLPLEPLPSIVSKSCEFSFIKEKYIDGVNKRKDSKPKRFDFIILYKGKPKILIETNFFSTSGGGTKIGINEGEYTDLHEDIQKFNKSHKSNLSFTWITDGNYWLSKNGETRFLNLKGNFFKGEFELLNYNLLKEVLPKIKQYLQS